ncbi:MAG: hypothetical protein K940chlam3_01275 [Chlamydiae bacterium]|nr:hypothetical protein [Chlamydiota bacterium]
MRIMNGRIPAETIRIDSGTGFKGKVKNFGMILGRKAGLIKESDLKLQQQYIEVGCKADNIIKKLRADKHNTSANDMESIRRFCKEDASPDKVRSFIKILNNTVKMGVMKPEYRDTAVEIFDLSIKQQKIAKELDKRGVSVSNPAGVFDNVEVGTDIKEFVDGLFNGFDMEDRQIEDDEVLPEGVKTITKTVGEESARILLKTVTKKEAQKHFKIAGMFIQDKKNLQPLAVGKALMNAYDDEAKDKKKVIKLLKDYGNHFPDVSLSALDKIYVTEKNRKLRKALKKAMADILEMNKEEVVPFCMFSKDKDAKSPKKFGAEIASSKLERGSKEWKAKLKEFSDLIMYNDVMNMKNFNPGIDFLPLEERPDGCKSKLDFDATELSNSITLAIMQQRNPKKMTKVYDFFLEVMKHLNEQKVGERKGDAQGVNILMASLARPALSRLVDRGQITPDVRALRILDSEISIQSVNNARRQATAKAANKGVSLYVANEKGDINTILQNSDLRVRLFMLADKKVPGYNSLKEDLRAFDVNEPKLRLSRTPGVNEDKLYELSYKIAKRGG